MAYFPLWKDSSCVCLWIFGDLPAFTFNVTCYADLPATQALFRMFLPVVFLQWESGLIHDALPLFSDFETYSRNLHLSGGPQSYGESAVSRLSCTRSTL